ncbi:hypothetical protein CDD81_6716 [Ophiocordyceps australis]|uniref:CFEM domain-containing protein n=1 Tax=Ophiocordyceps australis TaxID=1399860 RepID=A0A2C5XHF0_9HYPO|nr:hypothetical protein CDD81_6716 [Ophiocordyceps australis]
MKATFIILVVARFAAAQDISDQPQCAVPCLAEALAKVGCPVQDIACACKPDNQHKIRSLAISCVLSKCKPDTAVKAEQAASVVCARMNAGQTDSVPTGFMTSSASDYGFDSATDRAAGSSTRASAPTASSTGGAVAGSVGGAMAAILGAVLAL